MAVLDTFSRTGDLTSDGETGADWEIAPWFISGGGGVVGGTGNITDVDEITLDGSSASWSLGTTPGNRAYVKASGIVAEPDVATFAQLDFTILDPVTYDTFASVYLVDDSGFIVGCAQVFSQDAADIHAMALGNYGEREYQYVAPMAAGSHILRLEIDAARTVLTVKFDGSTVITLTLTEASLTHVSFVVLGFELGAGNGSTSRYDRIEAGGPQVPILQNLPGFNEEGLVELADVNYGQWSGPSTSNSIAILTETAQNSLPEILTQWFSGSFVFRPADVAESIEFESGEARRRPLFLLKPPIQMSGEVEYSQAQFDEFCAWFEDVLYAGSVLFYVQVPAQGGNSMVWYEASFMSPYTAKCMNGGNYQVQMKLLLMGDPQLTKPVPSIRV